MVKVFKKNDKEVIYLPFDVVKQLGIKEDDEVDFFKYSDRAFLFAKKADITNLLMSPKGPVQTTTAPAAPAVSASRMSAAEIDVLKKLDTLRYPVRTVTNVEKLLDADEKKVLEQLMKKGAVSLYNNEKMNVKLYSISKSIYDNFLMRKIKQETAVLARAEAAPAAKAPAPKEPEVRKAQPAAAPYVQRTATPDLKNEMVVQLEEKGYVVAQTEAEASSVSLALEMSIRQGQILGTRAFNKKYYIVMRTFLERNSAKLVKELRAGPKSVAALAETISVDEDGVRGILYLMAEQGDVTENRRDTFALVE